mgnify:CR=1 FL=1
MRCLIETIQRGGIAEARDIDTGCLSLGRGADQAIRLQSRLAGLSHAVIEQGSDGKPRIRAIPPNLILHKGGKVTEFVLTPGDEFSIGNVSFTVREAPPGYDLHLEMKEPAGRPGKELEEALLAGGASGPGGFSMRRAAWILSLAIVILFFLTPLAGFVYKPLGSWLRTVPVLSDLSWNSGPISSAHAFFADDCNRCHEKAFVAVRNSVCTDCHKDTPHHFAAEFRETDALESNRCASCHKEHSGSEAAALIPHDQALCTRCHENIKAIAPDSTLHDVSDFGDGHPEFRATLATVAAGKPESIRVPLDPKTPLREYASLEFSHAGHLKKEGVKNAGGDNVKLDCANCHRPEPGGKYMAKLDFESQCRGCHQLNFEADDPKQELPHGDEHTLQKYLEGYYSARALKGDYRHLSAPRIIRERLRPGETPTPSENLEIKEWAVTYARDVNAEVMRFRVCGKCHAVSLNLESNLQQSWKIEPPGFGAHRFPNARFDHDKHKTQDCRDCHDVEKSEHSDDVPIKGIASCRECHGGPDAKNKVASTCIDCHGFHTSKSLAMDGEKLNLPAKAGAVPETKSPAAGNNSADRRPAVP